MINDRELRASSLFVKAEIRSQKIQTCIATVSGGQRGALSTGTARVYIPGYWRDRTGPFEWVWPTQCNTPRIDNKCANCYGSYSLVPRHSEGEVRKECPVLYLRILDLAIILCVMSMLINNFTLSTIHTDRHVYRCSIISSPRVCQVSFASYSKHDERWRIERKVNYP